MLGGYEGKMSIFFFSSMGIYVMIRKSATTTVLHGVSKL